MMASEVRDYLNHFIEQNGNQPVGVLLNQGNRPAVFEVVQSGRITLPERNQVMAAFIVGSQFEVLVIPASMQNPAPGKG
jgi:hypothetical protein